MQNRALANTEQRIATRNIKLLPSPPQTGIAGD
jgi:hypothetical protein